MRHKRVHMVNKGNSPTLDWAAYTNPSGHYIYVSTALPREYAKKMEQVGAILYAQGKIPSNTKGALGRYCIETLIDVVLNALK